MWCIIIASTQKDQPMYILWCYLPTWHMEGMIWEQKLIWWLDDLSLHEKALRVNRHSLISLTLLLDWGGLEIESMKFQNSKRLW